MKQTTGQTDNAAESGALGTWYSPEEVSKPGVYIREGSETLATMEIGPENDEQLIRSATICHQTICAWGANGAHRDRGRSVLTLLRKVGVQPYALRLTKAGHPAHPLYLPANLKPTVMP